MAEAEKHFLNSLFSSLNRGKIRYAVLRKGEGLPDSLNGSDLDILIAQADLRSFYSLILKRLLDEFAGKVVINTNNGAHLGIVYRYGAEFGGIQIDVFGGELPYLGWRMMDSEWILSRRVERNSIAVLRDDDATMLSFLKELLNMGAKGKTAEHLARMLEDADFDFEQYKEEFTHIYGDVATQKLFELFAGDKKTIDLNSLAGIFRNGLFGGKWRWLLVKMQNFLAKFYRFRRPPGFAIAFLGTDGSGKSTVINAITPALSDSVHGALFYQHMRPNAIPSLAQLLKGEKHQAGVVVTDPHASKSSGIFGSLLRLGYYSLDYIFGYWLKIYPVMVKKSSIFIFDRYFYDYLIDPRRARLGLPYWLRRLVTRFYPEPDLIICLGAEPEIMFERKRELPLDELRRQCEDLKKIAETRPNAVWVDTGCSAEESVARVMDIIADKMSSRYTDEW